MRHSANPRLGKTLQCAIALIVLAFTADAQEIDRPVDILLTPTCNNVPNEIRVVMNDDENDAFPATRTAPDSCRWNGILRGPVPPRSHFSLRLGIGRTDCHTVENPGGSVVRLRFECCAAEPARIVGINTVQAVIVGYVRAIQKTSDVRSVPCSEHGVFDEGEGTVEDVQFGREKLSLQLDQEPNPRMPGLLVDDPAVVRNAGRGGQKTLVPRSAILYALALQRKRKHGGDLSSNAGDDDLIKFREAGLNRVGVTVK
jgi:hypothetical protein